MDEKIRSLLYRVTQVQNGGGSHGLDHVLRVFHLCEEIGQEENADLMVLLPAALFHDIARHAEQETKIPHEAEGARIAEEYLRSVRFDDTRIPKISHAIRSHRFRSKEKPKTLEARILSDADKLDAMGAVGIARTFIRAGEHRGDIRDGMEHIRDKLITLRELMYTGTAKKLAEDRHRLVCSFLDSLTEEMSAAGDGLKRDPGRNYK